MLEWLKKNTEKAREGIASEVTKYRNKDFMIAIVSGCALTAYADGEVSSPEKQKMISFIKNSPELKVFDTAKVIKAFNDLCDQFDFDFEIGKAEALRNIGKIASKPEMARLLVRVCVAIANSDGNFDETERKMVSTICQELSLNSSDFDI